MSELVECYSGSEYAERPLAFQWEGRRIEVDRILTQVRLPDGKRFHVQTGDGRVFDLFYGEMSGEWRINPTASRTPMIIFSLISL